jgi:hypothetical protein
MGQNCGINVNETLTPNGTLKKIMKSLFNLMVPLNINGGLILIMKSALNDFKIEGRRIINLNYFFESLKSLKHHPGFNCNFEFIEIIISEKKIGFNSAVTLKCKFCGNINILY